MVNEGEKEGQKKEFGPPPNLHHRSTPLSTRVEWDAKPLTMDEVLQDYPPPPGQVEDKKIMALALDWKRPGLGLNLEVSFQHLISD